MPDMIDGGLYFFFIASRSDDEKSSPDTVYHRQNH